MGAPQRPDLRSQAVMEPARGAADEPIGEPLMLAFRRSDGVPTKEPCQCVLSAATHVSVLAKSKAGGEY